VLPNVNRSYQYLPIRSTSWKPSFLSSADTAIANATTNWTYPIRILLSFEHILTIPHVQTIPTELPLDNLAFTAAGMMAKSFLPALMTGLAPHLIIDALTIFPITIHKESPGFHTRA
jgi:hypothetical protein